MAPTSIEHAVEEFGGPVVTGEDLCFMAELIPDAFFVELRKGHLEDLPADCSNDARTLHRLAGVIVHGIGSGMHATVPEMRAGYAKALEIFSNASAAAIAHYMQANNIDFD